MLIVEYKEATASWDATNREWRSDVEDFADVLNENLPSDMNAPDVPYLKDGQEGLVLDRAKLMFGEDLKVIIFEPPPVPDEVEGQDD